MYAEEKPPHFRLKQTPYSGLSPQSGYSKQRGDRIWLSNGATLLPLASCSPTQFNILCSGLRFGGHISGIPQGLHSDSRNKGRKPVGISTLQNKFKTHADSQARSK